VLRGAKAYCSESCADEKTQTAYPGKKYDTGKLRYDLVPPEATEMLARVLTYGANKYDANNWQNLDEFESRYTAAMFRHFEAWRKGEKVDPESGLPHLGHAFCNIMFLLWKDLNTK